MSVILALVLAQAGPAFAGTVPQPNPALDAAHACLRAGLAERLAEDTPPPSAEERWGWAVTIADRCEAHINAAADSKEAVFWVDSHAQTTITKRQMLKAEANHFVDRLIREHYEAKA
jgi:hypothetical protein